MPHGAADIHVKSLLLLCNSFVLGQSSQWILLSCCGFHCVLENLEGPWWVTEAAGAD